MLTHCKNVLYLLEFEEIMKFHQHKSPAKSLQKLCKVRILGTKCEKQIYYRYIKFVVVTGGARKVGNMKA